MRKIKIFLAKGRYVHIAIYNRVMPFRTFTLRYEWCNQLWAQPIFIYIGTSVGIFPGTFPIFKSRDFWTSLVPGQQDHGTFKVSRSCPVLSRDLGPLVPGLPGTSRDLFGRLFERKKSIQRYMFFYFCKFFWQNYQFLIVNLSNEL